MEDKIPIRQELERQKAELVKMSNTKDKVNLFRNFVKRHQDVEYRALQVWRENVRFYKNYSEIVFILEWKF